MSELTNDHPDLVKARKIAMIEADVIHADIVRRWREKFGSCSPALVSGIISGTTRSKEKEKDLARMLKRKYGDLFVPSKWHASAK